MPMSTDPPAALSASEIARQKQRPSAAIAYMIIPAGALGMDEADARSRALQAAGFFWCSSRRIPIVAASVVLMNCAARGMKWWRGQKEGVQVRREAITTNFLCAPEGAASLRSDERSPPWLRSLLVTC